MIRTLLHSALLAIAVMLLPHAASAQILEPGSALKRLNAPLIKSRPQVVSQQAQMREPGTPLPTAPRRASNNEVFYKRPAGAFPGFIAMDPESHDFLGYYQNCYFQVTLYSPYTYRGVAHGTFIGEPYYKWEAECYNDSLGMFEWRTFNGMQDLSLRYDYVVCPFMPKLQVNDDLDTYTYQWTNNVFGNGESEGELVPWPSWEELVEDESTLLKSSFDFASNRRTDDDYYQFTYYGGMTPAAGGSYGYWFGKNAGYNGTHVDGIAQAFEKPEHPYLLKQVVLYAAKVRASEVVDMQCKVYRIDNVPDYQDTASVVLPEEPGELIATGTAQLVPNPDSEDEKLITFTFYKNDEDGLPQEFTPTIDDAILVVIDGYNSPEMSALSEFTALVSYVNNIDDGMGERAYIKVGKDDAEGNFDGHYQWRGLNNFFSYGELKTGLSIFITTDHPFLTSIDTGDDYQYSFPAGGGEMKKTIKDDNGQTVTVDGIKMASWTPSDDTDFGITCNGGELPAWLNISAADGSTDGKFNYLVNVRVTADALPEGMDYREATVRFAIPGNYLDYKFMQSRQGGEEPHGEGYRLAMSDAMVAAGDTVMIPVMMHNEGDVVAFETDIQLPEGFELVKEEGQHVINLSDRASQDHTCVTSELPDGTIHLSCGSPSNAPFAGSEGDLFYMAVKVPYDASGNNVVQLCNTRLTLGDFTEYVVEDAAVAHLYVKVPIPGDVNHDGEVTIADVNTVIIIIINGGGNSGGHNHAPSRAGEDIDGDVNGDGEINISDVNTIINIILGK